MDSLEIRLRLVEAAAKNPLPHAQGFAAGVLETARTWEAYVQGAEKNPGEPGQVRGTLHARGKR